MYANELIHRTVMTCLSLTTMSVNLAKRAARRVDLSRFLWCFFWFLSFFGVFNV